MGYDFHIVRTDEWWDEEVGGGISLSEWLALVAKDDTMCMDGFAEVDLPERLKFRAENDGLAVWSDYSGNKEGGNQAWFDFGNNGIVVKNPDKEILVKMLDIAAKLDARVIGDEGEEYRSPADLDAPPRESAPRSVPRRRKPWWKFW